MKTKSSADHKRENKLKRMETEDTIQTINYIPTNPPVKRDFDLSRIKTDSNSSMKMKNERLKAFELMRKKASSKSEINILSKMNLDNEPLQKKMYENLCEVKEEERENMLLSSNLNNKMNANDLIEDFEEYYSDKFSSLKTNTNLVKEKTYVKQNIANENTYECKLNYCLGVNTKSVGHIDFKSICFHKTDKWIGYLNKNLVIIEEFGCELNRVQHVLNDCRMNLEFIKISENGNILMSYYTNVENENYLKISPNILL